MIFIYRENSMKPFGQLFDPYLLNNHNSDISIGINYLTNQIKDAYVF